MERTTEVADMDELYHHGVLGQKWGVRRYQNADGSLTEEGRKRLKRDRTKLDERQSRANRWKDKANDRAASYNRSSRKLVRAPFEKPIKKLRYDWASYGYDRAVNSANRWYKKVSKRYGKMGVDALSSRQISTGKQFLEGARSNQMLQADMNSLMTSMKSQQSQLKRTKRMQKQKA